MMSEIYIAFSAPMVLANRGGRKDLTRRTRGLDRINEAPDEWELVGESMAPGIFFFQRTPGNEVLRLKSPYGGPGSILVCREAWRAWIGYDKTPPREIPQTALVWYEADGRIPAGGNWGKLRPAMFMMRWMVRDLREVVSVRPERLLDITDEDAVREGIEMPDGTPEPPDWWSYREEYFHLWDRINGPGSAAKNPWCWRVEFKVVTK